MDFFAVVGCQRDEFWNFQVHVECEIVEISGRICYKTEIWGLISLKLIQVRFSRCFLELNTIDHNRSDDLFRDENFVIEGKIISENMTEFMKLLISSELFLRTLLLLMSICFIFTVTHLQLSIVFISCLYKNHKHIVVKTSK